MRPPDVIARALDMPSPPLTFLSPTHDTVALLSRPAMPSLAELAAPELVLAGERINPRNNGPSRPVKARSITFQAIPEGTTRTATLPDDADVIAPLWSPDGRHLAFLLLRDDRVALWVADGATGRARELAAHVNATFGRPFEWLPDSSGLVVRMVPTDRGEPPARPRVPASPIIQETTGQAAPASTTGSLLRTPYDDSLFAYYFTSQVALVSLKGSIEPIGRPAIVAHMGISPNGRYILEKRLEAPFCHLLPASEFPAHTIVSDLAGKLVHQVTPPPDCTRPRLREDGIAVGPRSIEWRADANATLVWAEATGAARPRDHIYLLPAPFESEPTLLLKLSGRYVRTLWSTADLALVEARTTGSHVTQWMAINPSQPGRGRILKHFDRDTPVMRINPRGKPVLQRAPDGHAVLASGVSQGEPYLSSIHPHTGAVQRLWTGTSADTVRLDAVLDDSAQHLLVWHQSRTQPPTLFVLHRQTGSMKRLTDFADPAPRFAGIQHRFVPYERADGVPLGGTLYLPAGYDARRDGPLPMLMWAYPRDYASAAAVSPAGGNQNVFVRPRGLEPPLLLLLEGYAIFEPNMPIVGVDGHAPNDDHREQLVADARAAVDVVVALGVADRSRIAIAGHSYGAAMVVNLLAWSDLFRTGIAMSGAYNRTLTPFGFQTERRTLWQAPRDYLAMSSFLHADRINEPLLLIHGADDPKTGTVPMQSERLFAAIRELGGTARYVLLPEEGHSYRARESVMHTFWEINRWLDLYIGPGRRDASP